MVCASGGGYNGTAATKYCYDITASVPAMIAEANGGTVTNYYVREPGGELVMRQNGTDSKYYHFDELGSTLFLTDANGVQTDKYVYNAWGKVVSSSGTTVNPYKYVGRLGYYSDALTGLYMLGTRFYDPEAGVFTQRDAAKDGLSYYAYTSGNVMTAVDPWGESLIFDPGKWNKKPIVNNNNCYSYAMNDPQYLPRPKYGTTPQPGFRSGYPDGVRFGKEYVPPYLKPTFLSCKQIWYYAKKDYGLIDLVEGKCPKDWHKVCLFTSTDDYHWFRQDDNGCWSHKIGIAPVSGIQVPDPFSEASKEGYQNSCGCKCARDTPK